MNQQITVFPAPNGGESIALASPVGTGGEGAVYIAPMPDGRKVAVKVFSERKLESASDRDFLSRKIETMVRMGRANDRALIRHPMLAWPQLSVYDADGQWVGYAMKPAKGKPLSYLAHPMLYRNHFPEMDREKVAQMLVALLNAAQVLHNQGVFIGDVNLNNVLWDGEDVPCWIDVDSFQVDAPNGERFPCPVGRPEMTPREHLDGDYAKIVRTPESEFFSLAILVFQCLMLGRHPYEHIGGGGPVENLRGGHFPYKAGGAVPGTRGGVPKGPWHKIWSHYTYNLKRAFVDAFVDGARDPSKRPSVERWGKELEEYVRILNLPDSAPRADGEAEWRHSRDMIPAEEKPKDVGRRDPTARKSRRKAAARTGGRAAPGRS